MLSDVETKITAVVGDGLSTRAHLEVLQAPQPLPSLQPGKGAVRVSVTAVRLQSGFEREHFFTRTENGATGTQRVVGLEIVARIEFRVRPPAGGGDDAANLSRARGLLMEDMSFVVHRLGAASVRDGSAFAVVAQDPGFRVRGFDLDSGNVGTESANGVLSGELSYRGRTEIWPVGEAEPEGVIDAVETLVAPLPLRIVADRPAVPPGGATSVRIPSFPALRLRNVDTGQRGVVLIAVKVVSDLPPDRRGTIPSGRAGAEAGLRILESVGDEIVVSYQAPAGSIGGPRREYVAVHLATPEEGSGLLLGSVAIVLLPENP